MKALREMLGGAVGDGHFLWCGSASCIPAIHHLERIPHQDAYSQSLSTSGKLQSLASAAHVQNPRTVPTMAVLAHVPVPPAILPAHTGIQNHKRMKNGGRKR